jgi:hypothetical protein
MMLMVDMLVSLRNVRVIEPESKEVPAIILLNPITVYRNSDHTTAAMPIYASSKLASSAGTYANAVWVAYVPV